MLHVDYTTTYGVVRIKQCGKVYSAHIHSANALCAFIYHYKENGTKMVQLVMFLSDKKHIDNIMKNEGNLLGENVVSVKLNVYYKEARTLIEPMCKSGYKVTCYYEEPKNS